MPDLSWIPKEAQRSLKRLQPRIAEILTQADDCTTFMHRAEQHFPRVFSLLWQLYGWQYDFFYHLEQIMLTTARLYKERPTALRELDAQRTQDLSWYQHESMMGGVLYVDLFADNLDGVRQKIPYFQELGLTYLHLMPLFDAPKTNNDGGYAINDFRKVNPSLGTMKQLAQLAQELREAGISLVLDFVFNHTSDEHTWAQKALAGDPDYQDLYYLFPDRTLPDQYEQTLREIFPEQYPGNFTYRPEIKQWVWTTFNAFQWDLNYKNPATFNAMLGEMLFLANQGVEILRLDAVAFIWKEMGTSCENLPQAHLIIQAFNALTRIVAPSLLFKSEAIVHPDDVASYISVDECPTSYNPTMMALLWEALATREVKLLCHSMSKRFEIPDGTAWVNYVRVHDDIGWSFANEDALELGIHGDDHRQFLNNFYTGKYTGSFAKGLPFNYNPNTGDMRICGTTASLAGLEQAMAHNNPRFIEQSIRRILLIHNIILSAGGIPLLYIGDELATLNDYNYVADSEKKLDSRWVHRPRFDWERASLRTDNTTIEGRVFQALQHMIHVRQNTPELRASSASTLFFDTHNPHVLGFLRHNKLLVLSNFSERPQTIAREVLERYWAIPTSATNILTDTPYPMTDTLTLKPYTTLWLK